jgi:hypothetical protein
VSMSDVAFRRVMRVLANYQLIYVTYHDKVLATDEWSVHDGQAGEPKRGDAPGSAVNTHP